MSPVFMFPERNCMKRIKYDTYGKTGCDRLMLKEYLSKQKKQFYTLGQRHRRNFNLPVCSAPGRGRESDINFCVYRAAPF